MSLYKCPTGQGFQWVMKWEDYVKHGFDESKAWKEDHNPPIYQIAKEKLTTKRINKC